MSKDFYSNDHTIQTGAPGSGSGTLNLEGQDYVKMKGRASDTYSGIIEINDSILIKPGTDTSGVSYGITYFKGQTVILGSGTAGPPTVLTEGCDLHVYGILEAHTDSGTHEIYTENGSVDIGAPTGGVTIDTPTTTITGDLVVNGSISEIGGISNAGDINISTTSGGDIILSAAGTFNITADTSTFNGDVDFNGDVEITNEKDASYIAAFTNTSNNSNADILMLHFSGISSPSSTNNWVQFLADNSSRGSIQGAAAASNYYAFYSQLNADPTDYALNGAATPLVTAPGYAQFTSGNADFGEWLPIGNELEWNITEEAKKEFLKSSIFPVQEGIVLYVRESKIWKSGPGRGMVVTNRSIILGNKKEDGKLGVVVSFTGQVPTFVEGIVEDGDLLVPIEGTNHCKAINPDQVSFQDYRRAVGTAWGKKLTTEVGLVNCAIGIK